MIFIWINLHYTIHIGAKRELKTLYLTLESQLT